MLPSSISVTVFMSVRYISIIEGVTVVSRIHVLASVSLVGILMLK